PTCTRWTPSCCWPSHSCIFAGRVMLVLALLARLRGHGRAERPRRMRCSGASRARPLSYGPLLLRQRSASVPAQPAGGCSWTRPRTTAAAGALWATAATATKFGDTARVSEARCPSPTSVRACSCLDGPRQRRPGSKALGLGRAADDLDELGLEAGAA